MGPGEFEAISVQASSINPATCQMHGLSGSVVATICRMLPSSRPVAPWPNPSIERTSSSRLRLLAATAHVKR